MSVDPRLPRRQMILRRLKAEQFSRYFLLLTLVVITVVFFNMVKVFLVPVLLAAVFSTLFYPLYHRLYAFFGKRAGLSALACCVILLLGLLVPTYLVAELVSREAIQFYQTAEQQVREVIEKGDAGLLGQIKNSAWVERLRLDQVDWQSSLQEAAKTAGTALANFINKTSKGTLQLVTNLFVTLFTMYYFFKDGHKLVKTMKYLVPLDEVYEEAIIMRFVSVSRATIKGTILIAMAQGAMGALTLWVFGVGSPVLWGVVMVVLSIIPMVGAWLVLYPAAFVQLLMGNAWQGLAIFLSGAIVVGNIDNLLRPRLVGRESGMHELMTFFATLGGLTVFGVMGFIVGPVIAALFLTILDIYSVEFKSHLELAQTLVTEKQAQEKAAATPAGEE